MVIRAGQRRKKKTAKSPSLHVKLIGAVVSLFIFIALTEVSLRLVDVNLYHKSQFFPVNRDIDFPDVYKRDPKLFWRFREGIVTESMLFSRLQYRINSHGMRGPEIKREKTGYRIIALGNSCTFGWGMPYEMTWVYQLQQTLNRQVPSGNVEILNTGVPGYSTHQGRIYFAEELISLQPDMVLIMFGWNDHWQAGNGITDAQQQQPNRAILELQNLFSKLKLYQLLRKVVLSMTEKEQLVALDDISGERRVSKEEFYENLKAIVQLARDNGIQPVLLVPPIASLEHYFQFSTSKLHLLHGLYQKQIVHLAELERVPLVNLQAAFDQYNDLFDAPRQDPIHFNTKGQTVAEEAVAEVVVPLVATQ